MIKIKGLKYQDKLVRNKIPEIIEKDGNKTALCKFIDSVDDYKLLLWEKLFEEMTEAEAAGANNDCHDEYDKDELIEELADVQEVLTAICNVYGIEPHEIRKKQLSKNIERGNFSGRILLVEVIEHEKTND